MSCGCRKPQRTPLWTPIPPFRVSTSAYGAQPSHYPLPGENIDCFAKRAPENGKDDAREKISNLIENTAIVVDKNGNVDTTFKLTPNSDKVVASWRIWTDDQPGTGPTGLNFNTTTGQLSGQVPESARNKNYKVEVKAFDSNGDLIDSRQYNMYPKLPAKGEDIQFVWPLVPKGVVTSGFGPRKSPTPGASSIHKGVDIAIPGGSLGDIVAAADGVVLRAGPASGYGNAVFIEHRDANGNVVATTVYGHMSEIYVTAGQTVSSGQKIAKEGSVGVGTGPHLHFELHKGKLGNPVDPLPYINGVHEIEGEDPIVVKDSVMVAGEQNTGPCGGELPSQFGAPRINEDAEPSSKRLGGQASNQSSTEPRSIPMSSNASKAEVQRQIQRALDEDPSLTPEDKKYLMFVAGIESNYKADAKNPYSSARGVYQMLDKTANTYYAKIGYPNPTEEQRNDPYLATKAQIEFYKSEQKPYYDEFRTRGTIAGKQLDPAVAARYQNLTQGEFTYGLIHHDGVGNAIQGRDMQGVDYYRRSIRAIG
jgi:murein DD-endopeptidase MepM/ murein hydrolase activator NlpD